MGPPHPGLQGDEARAGASGLEGLCKETLGSGLRFRV